ncbi:hypothetical protein HJG60_011455 [Phyllostomus discolor]|uniref:Uncharacterized protein n=1 Tax=Phyllostomus discolor TaxID=89673 RepID=A0A833ZVR9_9CHIR|nr:hypothetical protein HJG60_011455 [Phyllostomus discolor]
MCPRNNLDCMPVSSTARAFLPSVAFLFIFFLIPRVYLPTQMYLSELFPKPLLSQVTVCPFPEANFNPVHSNPLHTWLLLCLFLRGWCVLSCVILQGRLVVSLLAVSVGATQILVGQLLSQ